MDKEKAFRNWMDRDILFADTVRKQCGKMGYKSILNDGSIFLDALIRKVCLQFELEDWYGKEETGAYSF